MAQTYFLSNRKEKKALKLIRQIQMFCQRKNIDLNSDIKIEISEAMNSETKFNTIKININNISKKLNPMPPPSSLMLKY
jgi:hypothetical protein